MAWARQRFPFPFTGLFVFFLCVFFLFVALKRKEEKKKKIVRIAFFIMHKQKQQQWKKRHMKRVQCGVRCDVMWYGERSLPFCCVRGSAWRHLWLHIVYAAKQQSGFDYYGHDLSVHFTMAAHNGQQHTIEWTTKSHRAILNSMKRVIAWNLLGQFWFSFSP